MLLIGYGNQGRGDDGLGPVFAARMEERDLPDLVIDADYQLTVDHALMVSEVESVVFVDAAVDTDRPFYFKDATPAENANISSHSLTPAAVLRLAKTLYGATPQAYVLGISGRVFGDVREGLSAEAIANLDLAEAFFLDWLTGSRTRHEVHNA